MKIRTRLQHEHTKLVRRIMWFVAAVGFAATSYFSYLFAIAEFARRELPLDWAPELGEMSFQQIYAKIGLPEDDATAKQFQNWIESHWWGIKMLKIISSDCCKPTARPNQISFVVYAKGRYRPVHSEILFLCERKSRRTEQESQ